MVGNELERSLAVQLAITVHQAAQILVLESNKARGGDAMGI
jgi:hypothetical protein